MQIETFTFLCQSGCLLFLFLTAQVSVSGTKWKGSSEMGHSDLVPNYRRRAMSFITLSRMLNGSFVINSLPIYKVKEAFLYL